jgi:recombinational DNA repair ATPase RecF
LKLVELRAENVKRLKAVRIKPDGNIVQITGRNAQGKTSVLDSIWYALQGRAKCDRPIRDGAESAEVEVNLGDLIVKRKWTDKGSYLSVENLEGAVYKSPQAILDKLVGELTFDPLAFTRMTAKLLF